MIQNMLTRVILIAFFSTLTAGKDGEFMFPKNSRAFRDNVDLNDASTRKVLEYDAMFRDFANHEYINDNTITTGEVTDAWREDYQDLYIEEGNYFQDDKFNSNIPAYYSRQQDMVMGGFRDNDFKNLFDKWEAYKEMVKGGMIDVMKGNKSGDDNAFKLRNWNDPNAVAQPKAAETTTGSNNTFTTLAGGDQVDTSEGQDAFMNSLNTAPRVSKETRVYNNMEIFRTRGFTNEQEEEYRKHLASISPEDEQETIEGMSFDDIKSHEEYGRWYDESNGFWREDGWWGNNVTDGDFDGANGFKELAYKVFSDDQLRQFYDVSGNPIREGDNGADGIAQAWRDWVLKCEKTDALVNEIKEHILINKDIDSLKLSDELSYALKAPLRASKYFNQIEIVYGMEEQSREIFESDDPNQINAAWGSFSTEFTNEWQLAFSNDEWIDIVKAAVKARTGSEGEWTLEEDPQQQNADISSLLGNVPSENPFDSTTENYGSHAASPLLERVTFISDYWTPSVATVKSDRLETLETLYTDELNIIENIEVMQGPASLFWMWCALATLGVLIVCIPFMMGSCCGLIKQPQMLFNVKNINAEGKECDKRYESPV